MARTKKKKRIIKVLSKKAKNMIESGDRYLLYDSYGNPKKGVFEYRVLEK